MTVRESGIISAREERHLAMYAFLAGLNSHSSDILRNISSVNKRHESLRNVFRLRSVYINTGGISLRLGEPHFFSTPISLPKRTA